MIKFTYIDSYTTAWTAHIKLCGKQEFTLYTSTCYLPLLKSLISKDVLFSHFRSVTLSLPKEESLLH